jgi:hypothetical protein
MWGGLERLRGKGTRRKGRGANTEEVLFGLTEEHLVPKYKSFVALMRKLLGRAKYEESQYYSHSFRIGAATTAAMLGMSKEEIKTMGRWSSECWNLYVRPDLGEKAMMTAKLDKLKKQILT